MADVPEPLEQLYTLLRERVESPPPVAESYTAELLAKGEHHRARKFLEEAAETAMAGLAESPERLAEESADLLYHLTLLWAVREIPPAQVFANFADAHGRENKKNNRNRLP